MEINQNYSPNSVYLIGTIRERLHLRTRFAMEQSWQEYLPGSQLPGDHSPADMEDLKTFLKGMSVSRRGRSSMITLAAVNLLKEIEQPAEPAKEVVPEVRQEEIKPASELPISSDLRSSAGSYPEESFFVAWLKNLNRWVKSLTALDFVFFLTMGVADYGLVFLMKEMGFIWASVYTLVSFHALSMTKKSHAQMTAKSGIAAVVVLEIFAFFVHVAMFNLRAWQAAKEGQMPFSPYEYPQAAFWISVALAALLSGAGIYAVSTTLSLTTESVEAENFEKQHGLKY